MSNATRTATAARSLVLYAACYPYGMLPGKPRTLVIFRGPSAVLARSRWIAERWTSNPIGDGYRCPLQSADLTASQRASLRSI